jgi:hypothetical protein
MRWSRRTIVIGTSAAAAAIALAVTLVLMLPAHHTPPAAPKPSPARLFSPFTGEPVTALGPVLGVKIDNLAPAAADRAHRRGHRLRPAGGGGRAYVIRWSRPGADGGTTFTTMSGQVMTFARGPV